MPTCKFVSCYVQKLVSRVFLIVWQLAEPLLFALIGAEVALEFISPSLVGGLQCDNESVCDDVPLISWISFCCRSGYCSYSHWSCAEADCQLCCCSLQRFQLEVHALRTHSMDTESHSSGK